MEAQDRLAGPSARNQASFLEVTLKQGIKEEEKGLRRRSWQFPRRTPAFSINYKKRLVPHSSLRLMDSLNSVSSLPVQPEKCTVGNLHSYRRTGQAEIPNRLGSSGSG